MKKKKSDPPHDFEVEDAEIAFGKLEDATRRLLSAPKRQSDIMPRAKSKTKHRKR